MAGKAGRTLDDFKPDLHPWTIWPDSRLDANIFFVQKILYCVVPLQLFICSRSRWSVVFDIYDSWLGCLCRDHRDSQGERVSVTYWMLHASIAKPWQPQTCHESREHHPYSFIYFVFYCETERVPGESADNVDCPLCFSSLVTFDLASVHEIKCHCEIVPTVIKCVFWSNHLVCVLRGL